VNLKRVASHQKPDESDLPRGLSSFDPSSKGSDARQGKVKGSVKISSDQSFYDSQAGSFRESFLDSLPPMA
jgi:hypothetical protein